MKCMPQCDCKPVRSSSLRPLCFNPGWCGRDPTPMKPPYLTGCPVEVDNNCLSCMDHRSWTLERVFGPPNISIYVSTWPSESAQDLHLSLTDQGICTFSYSASHDGPRQLTLIITVSRGRAKWSMLNAKDSRPVGPSDSEMVLGTGNQPG